MLLSTDLFRDSFLKASRNAGHIYIISAFVKEAAVNWLSSAVGPKTNVHLVLRGRPDDFLAKSSDLSALKYALNSGWKVSVINSLHAKIYLIDSCTLYVGSANFTKSGLKLFGTGNIEVCHEGQPSKKDIEFVKLISKSSTTLTGDAISLMEKHLSSLPRDAARRKRYAWPEDVLKIDLGNVYVSDFMFDHEDDDFEEAQALFMGSVAFRWLLRQLNEENGCLYFGSLSQRLHSSLVDDPTPYRSEVKRLLQSLLKQVEVYCTEDVIIDRPRHSQRVQLVQPL